MEEQGREVAEQGSTCLAKFTVALRTQSPGQKAALPGQQSTMKGAANDASNPL